MAAPIKTRLDYYPREIGLAKDRKFRPLKLKYGFAPVDIYEALLDLIYGDKGYYIEYSPKTKDSVIWDIFEYLQAKYQPTAETIEEIIEGLVACELFSDDLFKKQILSSNRIQETYYKCTVERSTIDINFDIWILSKDKMKSISSKSAILRNFINRPNYEVNQPNNEEIQPDNSQSKANKSKVNKSKVVVSIPTTGKSFEVTGEFFNLLQTTYTTTDVKQSLDNLLKRFTVYPDKRKPYKETEGYIKLWVQGDYESGKCLKFDSSYDIDTYENSSIFDE